MRFLFVFVLALLLFSSCDEESEYICADSEFIFVNLNGDDIFNENTPNHLRLSQFEVFTKDNVGRLNFTGISGGTNIFNLWLYGEIEKEGYTYLKFGELNIDTIYAKFEEIGNSLFISELYYNGELIEENIGPTQCGTHTHTISIKED